MAGKKLLRLVSGIYTEIVGTQTSAGVGNAGDIVALADTGYLDPTVMPPGSGPDVKTITASEALSAGDLVNLHNSSGLKVRKADASSSAKEADGYILASVLISASATVYFDGLNTAVSGLTPGTDYYLSDSTPGGVTSTPVSGTGKINQFIGTATAAGELVFERGEITVLA